MGSTTSDSISPKRVARLTEMLNDAMSACLSRWGPHARGLRRAHGAPVRGREPYELRPTDVRERVLLSSGGISNVINRLAKSGFVERVPDAADGRSRWVRLTPSGLELTEDIILAWAEAQADFFRAVPADACQSASDALRQVLIGLGDDQPAEP